MSLTFSDLKAFAKDQLQSKGDTMAVRRAGRVVNKALKMVSAEKNWSFQRIRHRVLLRPNVSVSGVTMEPYARQFTMDSTTLTGVGSNGWASTASWYFSGDTEVMRIQSASASGAVMFSTDVYNASTAASNATGTLVFDRIPLPDNFRALWRPPQEKDYYVGLQYVEPEEFLYFKQTYDPSSGGGIIFYTEQRNPVTNKWELHLWPGPDVFRTMDMYIYVYPPTLTNDSDIALWPDELEFVLHSAIEFLIVKELRRTKDYTSAQNAYWQDLNRAKDWDFRGQSAGPAGGQVRYGNKIQRSRHFVDES